ncbi:helix-turn-helix domain-containing protein [Micromonospora endolithica]|uniref:XRE family transcriptional regulator n=1 Tax=Micromonospora endolithica TaxID=230091 RepID=A0A3A9YRL7_9ACTN|nr:helix-turn-helix domain-containing protein [Micromonospora endolithica]RKN38662.1 XRE family transcriptional regulator [Micromonospora endolithica]TWJ25274.1 transcriptional regulator with XRE-family HTH domain [Micromonospora endolithica]
MAQTRINVPALYAALDAARKSKSLSWRQLAAEVGCSPSTMTRLANGYRPDADAFMTLTQWLKMPAETFWISETEESQDEEPELLAEVGVLLRARKDLGEEERQHLQNVLEAAMKLHATQRAARNR